LLPGQDLNMGSLGYELAEANSWERYCELRQARSGVDHRKVAEGCGRPLRIGWFIYLLRSCGITV
jgi:hypothetical protein